MKQVFIISIALVSLGLSSAGLGTKASIPAPYRGKWASDATSCKESEPTTISADRILFSDEDERLVSLKTVPHHGLLLRVRSMDASKLASGQSNENLLLTLKARTLTIAYPDKNGRQDPWVLVRCR